MNFISKIFGGKAPTAASVADRIAAIEAEHTAALAREAAARTRLADLASLTDEEHDAAETAQAEGRRAAARAEAQIAELRTAQAEAEAREEREAFDRDVAAHERETDELAVRTEREYPELAGKLADLMSAHRANKARGEALAYRARSVGKSYWPRSAEAFRRPSPQTWRVSWPNPDAQAGGVVAGNAESAPRGMIRWQDGEPAPAREGVTVKARRREYPVPLLNAITHLPALHYGQPDHWQAPADPQPAFHGAI